MTTITLPPDVEETLAKEAQRQGITPERLAVDCLRKQFISATTTGEQTGSETLFDFLSGYIGTVRGTTEALSEHCGRRFAQGLAERQGRGGL